MNRKTEVFLSCWNNARFCAKAGSKGNLTLPVVGVKCHLPSYKCIQHLKEFTFPEVDS